MDTIGLDLHKRESQLCMGHDDGTADERRITTSGSGSPRWSGTVRRPRMFLDASTETEWVARQLDQRRLNDTPYPYLMVDALVERVRREGQVRHTAVLYVMGIRPDGFREFLGTWTGAAESAESWRQVFHELTERGLRSVQYVVSDEHVGLVQSIRRFVPHAVHQRCQVHYLRNALSKISNETLQQEVTRGLAAAWAAATREEAARRRQALAASSRPRAAKLADWLDDTSAATLALYTLEDNAARRKLRSTNTLERHHVEVRRRTRVIGIVPHEANLLRLATALAIDWTEKASRRRYLPLSSLPTRTARPEEVPLSRLA